MSQLRLIIKSVIFFGIILFSTGLYPQWRGYDVYRCGAKGLAAGGAFTSIADDSSAIYYNPAGLIQIKNTMIFYTMDAQVKLTKIIQPQLKLVYQVPALLGFVIPLSNNYHTVLGFAVDSPFQRKIPNEFAVYKFAPQFSTKISRKLSWGASIGLNYATYSSVGSSDGWGWGFQTGFLYFPVNTFSLGINYQSKIKIHWPRHLDSVNVDETFPDILTGGAAFFLNPKLLFSFDLEYQNWKGIKYIENGKDTAPVDQIKDALFKTLHPHVGFMFLESGSGAHVRTGFYTDSFIERDQAAPDIFYHKTQLLWTIGLGLFAYRKVTENVEKQVLKLEIALADSLLTYYLNKDNNRIETIQLSAEYQF